MALVNCRMGDMRMTYITFCLAILMLILRSGLSRYSVNIPALDRCLIAGSLFLSGMSVGFSVSYFLRPRR